MKVSHQIGKEPSGSTLPLAGLYHCHFKSTHCSYLPDSHERALAEGSKKGALIGAPFFSYLLS